MLRDPIRPDDPRRPREIPVERDRPGPEAALETRQGLRDPAPRRDLHLGDRVYWLNEAQEQLMRDVGAFRALLLADLAARLYAGDRSAALRDVRNLVTQGLLGVVTSRSTAGILEVGTRYVTLTRQGRRLTEKRLRTQTDQRIYAGVVKLREIKHDAALYRVYQRALDQIQARGGLPRRVVLDYELKRRLNRDLRGLKKLSPVERAAKLQDLAERNHLQVVGGQIPLPDVRVEYDTSSSERAYLDLEYVTPNYRAGMLAQKALAGFQLYADRGPIGGRALEELRSLAAEILAL